MMMKNSNGMGKGVLVAALLVVGLLVAGPAYAIVFELTSDHCSGTAGGVDGCIPTGGNAGTVTVAQNGANLDVTVDLANGYSFAKTGAVDFQAFKFNATGIVLADITVDQTVSGETLAAQQAAAPGGFNGNGTGEFTFGIACTTCDNGGSDAFTDNIVFHVANATIADITASNNLGNIFVADVLAPNGLTGPVDVTGSSVPEPASLMLLGAGLAGIGLWQWRRRKVGQA